MFYVECTLSAKVKTFSEIIEIAHRVKMDDVFGVDFPDYDLTAHERLGHKIRIISESKVFLRRFLASIQEQQYSHIRLTSLLTEVPLVVPENYVLRSVRGVTPKNKDKDNAKKMAFLISKGASNITLNEFKLKDNPSIVLKSSSGSKVVHIIDIKESDHALKPLLCNSYGYCLNVDHDMRGGVPHWK